MSPETTQQIADLWAWFNPALAGRKRADGSDIRYLPELLDTLNLENNSGSRVAGGSYVFVQDPRNGKVYAVWGTMWKRWIRSGDEWGGWNAYWGSHGADLTLQVWNPIHIDALTDVDELMAAAKAARDLAQSNADTLAKVLALAKGELPEPVKVLDVEASLAQANLDQLISALRALLGKKGSDVEVASLLT